MTVATAPRSGSETSVQIALPRLPYPCDALEPHISRATLEMHHGTIHRAYVETTRALARRVRLADKPLERIIRDTVGQRIHAELHASAALAWSHGFYWRSLSPRGGGMPDGPIRSRIDADFGDYETFARQFKAAATGHSDSGWAWLVLDADKLRIVSTPDADTPLVHGLSPLLAIDLSEHAYFLDYLNRRAEYARVVVEHLINWDFANSNLRRDRARRGRVSFAQGDN